MIRRLKYSLIPVLFCALFPIIGQADIAVSNEYSDPTVTGPAVAAGEGLIVVGAHRRASDTAEPPSSITHDSVGLTLAVMDGDYTGTSDEASCSIWYLANPNDTTAVIVPAATGNGNDIYYAYTVTDLATSSVVANSDADEDNNTNSLISLSASLTSVDGGFAVGVLSRSDPGGDYTAAWTNLTEAFDAHPSAHAYSGADALTTGTAGLTVSVVGDSDSGLGDQVLCAAVFNQAVASTVTVTDVDTDESITAGQLNVVVTGTGFGATQGAGTVELTCAGQTAELTSIDSWADTSIQFDEDIVGFGVTSGLKYGTCNLTVTNNSAADGSLEITATAQTGVDFVNIGTAFLSGVWGPTDTPFDEEGNPGRCWGFPTDLTDGDQMAIGNVMADTSDIDDITLNADGSFIAPEDVTAVDCDYSSSSAYSGSEATLELVDPPPEYGTAATLQNFVLAKDEAMAAIDLSDGYFSGATSYSYQQRSAPTAESTCDGTQSGSSLVVTDESGYTAGDHIQIDADNDKWHRVLWIDPFNSRLHLDSSASCTDLDDVDIGTIGNATTSGLSISMTEFQGTPDMDETDDLIVFRASDGTLTTDSTGRLSVTVDTVASQVGNAEATATSTLEGQGFTVTTTRACGSDQGTGNVDSQTILATDFVSTIQLAVGGVCQDAGGVSGGFINLGI
jgi:hypothetical protein